MDALSPCAAKASARTLAFVLALGLAGCCVTPPEPSDWLNVGFRSPQQTWRTYQTALAGDQAELEYRCFASSFKGRYGFSVLEYVEFRDQLLAEQPLVRFAAEAEVVAERRSLDGGYHELIAEISKLGTTVQIRVLLEREAFAELWVEDEQVQSIGLDRLDDAQWSQLNANNRSGFGVSAFVDYDLWENPPPNGDYDEAAVSEFRIGAEWKIADLAPVEAQTADDGEAEAPEA